MALKDEQLMAIQHIYTARRRVCMATDKYGKYHPWDLPFVFMPHIHFGKAEVAYRNHGLASYVSTWCSCTLQSYILLNIFEFPCYYLQVQLKYLDELHGECSGTARRCVNSGKQALLSYLCQAPGNKAITFKGDFKAVVLTSDRNSAPNHGSQIRHQ